jgi:ADP-ribose pyrophosphatase
MHLFLAQDILPGTASPEDDERILPRPFSFVQLLQMIQSGRIKDGKSLVGLLYWAQWKGKLLPRRK